MPLRKISVPDASIVNPTSDGRLTAPSADRNVQAITALLKHHGPSKGQALEIASGTGQHIVSFAEAFPDVMWQPTEIEETRRESIAAWVAYAQSTNVGSVARLDATPSGWSAQLHDFDLVIAVNLLHLISHSEAQILLQEAALALASEGRLIVYGPFLRDGETTSEGDRQFHASLAKVDPEIGYKDDFDVIDWIHDAGLELVDVVEMPANNLSFVAQKN